MSEMKSLTLNGKKYDSFVDAVARPLAETAAVICSASGEGIAVFDSSDHKLLGLSIYGKSTQNGVPTPGSPVDIVSLTNPTITINGKSLVVPHSIPGIPVTSGGNYTDANGQQWVCDEIDLARGVYVQRINTFAPQSAVRSYDNAAGTNRVVSVCADAARSEGSVVGAIMCDSLPTVSANDQYLANESSISGAYEDITITLKDITSEDAVIQWLIENPIKVQYVLATPIEIPLSEEELATYGSLYSTKPSTTVTNNAGAYMSMEYVADTKAYIDNRVSNMAPATVE